MFARFHPLKIRSSRHLWRRLVLAGMFVLAASGHAWGDTDLTYFTHNYAYDNLGHGWYDTTMRDPSTGNWVACNAPDDPGSITGGDNWSYSTINNINYAFDSVISAWYVDAGYDQDYLGEIWSPSGDPTVTDFDYTYNDSTGYSYRYDNVWGNWFRYDSSSGDWSLLSGGPDNAGVLTHGANWIYSTVNGTNYAYDSVLDAWYVDAGYDSAANSETWTSCSQPTQDGGSGGGGGDGGSGDSGPTVGNLTAGSLLVDADAHVFGGLAVASDFVIGGTAFNPAGLATVYDADNNFLGWQLYYAGLQNGVDASFSSLSLNASLSVPEISGNVSISGAVRFGVSLNGYTVVGFTGPDYSVILPTSLWHWQQNGAATAVDQMSFDYAANLNLFAFGNSTQHKLSLQPGSLALATQNNSDTAQTYHLLAISTNSSMTVLTLADGFVLDATARSFRLGNATITGSDAAGAIVMTDTHSSSNIAFSPANQSLVFSNGFSVSGNSSLVRLMAGGAGVAYGGNATVSGNDAVALAGGVAAGNLAVAMGANSSATADGALVVGANSVASASGAMALAGGNASANQAIAIGPGTQSQTWGTTVVGHYNAPIAGNATAYSAADPAFVVGIGANGTALANGLVIYNNGDAAANGDATLTHPAYVSPTNATQPVELTVNGITNFNGPASLNGNVIVAPQGSLPMGAFGN